MAAVIILIPCQALFAWAGSLIIHQRREVSQSAFPLIIFIVIAIVFVMAIQIGIVLLYCAKQI
jgi:hypothetical protein